MAEWYLTQTSSELENTKSSALNPPSRTRVQSLDDGGHIAEDAGVHQC